MKPFAAAPPPGAQPPPLWGSEEHLRRLLGERVQLTTVQRDALTITAFPRAHDYAARFEVEYLVTVATRR